MSPIGSAPLAPDLSLQNDSALQGTSGTDPSAAAQNFATSGVAAPTTAPTMGDGIDLGTSIGSGKASAASAAQVSALQATTGSASLAGALPEGRSNEDRIVTGQRGYSDGLADFYASGAASSGSAAGSTVAMATPSANSAGSVTAQDGSTIHVPHTNSTFNDRKITSPSAGSDAASSATISPQARPLKVIGSVTVHAKPPTDAAQARNAGSSRHDAAATSSSHLTQEHRSSAAAAEAGSSAAHVHAQPQFDQVGQVVKSGFDATTSGISSLTSSVGSWAAQNDPLNVSDLAKQAAADPLGAAVRSGIDAALPLVPATAFAYDTAKSTVDSAATIVQHAQTAADELKLASDPMAAGGAAVMATASRIDPAIGQAASNAIDHPNGSPLSLAVDALPGAPEEHELAKDPETASQVAGAIGNVASTFAGDGIAKAGTEVAKAAIPAVVEAAGRVAGPTISSAANAAKDAAVEAYNTHVAPHVDRLMNGNRLEPAHAPAGSTADLSAPATNDADALALRKTGTAKRLPQGLDPATDRNLTEAGFERVTTRGVPGGGNETEYRLPNTEGTLTIKPGATMNQNEVAGAKYLLETGSKEIKALPESKVHGQRSADFEVDGERTELKTQANSEPVKWVSNVSKQLSSSEGQAKHTFVDARRQHGVTQDRAKQVVQKALIKKTKFARIDPLYRH